MIRNAEFEDMPRILEIFSRARDFMKKNGNANQWGETHPPQITLEEDILQGQLYVYLEDNIIQGVFAFIFGEDPTYASIEGGAWLNDAPYATIHRIASSGEVKGVFNTCLDYCKDRIDNLRIDTHKDNIIMQHLITKYGFKKCGVVYMEDGSPRIAYHYVK